jgi:adenine nucleotide transporter 17
LADDARYRYDGALDVLAKSYRSDGIPGWYKGMAQQLFKGIVTQAILFQTKEQWSSVVLMLFRFLSSLRGGMRANMSAQKEL